MVDAIIFFLPPMVGFLLLIIGFSYKNYVFTIFSGLLFLSLSVATFINPIIDLSSLSNDILASFYFAVGAYLFIVSSIELYQEYLG